MNLPVRSATAAISDVGTLSSMHYSIIRKHDFTFTSHDQTDYELWSPFVTRRGLEKLWHKTLVVPRLTIMH